LSFACSDGKFAKITYLQHQVFIIKFPTISVNLIDKISLKTTQIACTVCSTVNFAYYTSVNFAALCSSTSSSPTSPLNNHNFTRKSRSSSPHLSSKPMTANVLCLFVRILSCIKNQSMNAKRSAQYSCLYNFSCSQSART
jgi:hypothetical protein